MTAHRIEATTTVTHLEPDPRDLSRLNIPLLTKVRDHIAAHPEEHRQDHWATRTACGTAYCFAGHAVVMTGHDVDWSGLSGRDSGPDHVVGGRIIPNVAREELGLTWREASALFAGNNALADIEWLLERITDGAIPRTDPTASASFDAKLGWCDIERHERRPR